MSHRRPSAFASLSQESLDRVQGVFADVRRSLGLPWVGELFEALAVYDRYLEAGWYQLKPSVMSTYFDRVERDIHGRCLAAVSAGGLPFSDHAGAVRACGDGDAPAELAGVLEVFERLNPAMLLLATAVRDSLLGWDVGACPPRTGPDAVLRAPRHAALPSLRFAGDRAADAAGPAGTHVTSREFGALALWPQYLELIKRELRPLVRSDVYRRTLAELDTFATAAARALPYPLRGSGELARSQGYTPAEIAEMLDTAILLQQQYAELSLQFAALRIGWSGGNLGEG